MRLVRGLDRLRDGSARRAVTLGNFDGVHMAHQEICRRVVAAALELKAEPTVLTFQPHPVAVLVPERAPALLLRLRDRIRLVGAAGVELIVVQRFTPAFSKIDPERFVRDFLVARLGAVHVVVGHNVRFGRDRAGDGELLQRLAPSCGFAVEVVGPVRIDESVVSSSAIRRAVAAGDVRRAGRMLGREYFVRGRVEHGAHRGAKLGFPTANIRTTSLLPPDGVYAVRADVGGRIVDGIANLGFKPTFRGEHRSLEAHLFDFDGDLYGRRVTLAFVERLRGERKFASAEELARQIRLDVEAVKAALSKR